jgi:hypothetical protein
MENKMSNRGLLINIIIKNIKALKIKNTNLSNAFGGLPPQKLKCSLFAKTLIKSALKINKI